MQIHDAVSPENQWALVLVALENEFLAVTPIDTTPSLEMYYGRPLFLVPRGVQFPEIHDGLTVEIFKGKSAIEVEDWKQVRGRMNKKKENTQAQQSVRKSPRVKALNNSKTC